MTEDFYNEDAEGWQESNLFRLGLLNSEAGNEDEAARLWSEYAKIADIESKEETDPLEAAQYYAWQGDLDKAFPLLEKAYENRNMWLTRITVFPWYAPLRGDPRYDDLVKRMGLR